MGEFKHKHSLGQNFLKDKSVLTKIIDSVDVKEDDLIIEVGPGQGALTKYLKLFHANLRCYEVDERVKPYLEKFLDEKTEVVFNDFLKVNLEDDIKDIEYNDLYVIANLPYYITTPIIEKMIESPLNVKAMVLMVQNEVADRLSAKCGSKEYGAISVYLHYYYKVEKLFFVSRKAFDPVPKVDSAVIKLEKKEKELELINKDKFFRLVRDSFMMKRKNLRNNLRNYDLDKINNVLVNYGLDISCRAEQVPLECFVDMANEISK
jgi:16S rRNA (adenine1518-N6/adenine1519-N6)-dimethyltransferase